MVLRCLSGAVDRHQDTNLVQLAEGDEQIQSRGVSGGILLLLLLRTVFSVMMPCLRFLAACSAAVVVAHAEGC